MTTTAKKMKVAKLIFDEALYPRHSINGQHLSDMKKALMAGVELPPIIAEAKTMRVVDGAHRLRAYIDVFGSDAEALVELRTYNSEQDLVWEAVHLNAGHGQRLTHFDQARSIVILREVGYDPEDIARALNTSRQEIENLEARKMAIGPDAKAVPIKRIARHLAGGEISELQLRGNRRAVGVDQVYLVNRVIDLFEYDLLDESNQELLARLGYLARKIRARGIDVPNAV